MKYHAPAVYLMVLVIMGGLAFSCRNDGSFMGDTVDSIEVENVDSLVKHQVELVGKKVKISGKVSEIGKAEERRMFLEGSDDSIVVRCDATFRMGGKFPFEDVGKNVEISGLVQELKITNSLLTVIENNYMVRLGQYRKKNKMHTESDSVIIRKALDAGFPMRDLTEYYSDSALRYSLETYRRNIADRKEREGKDYLSIYYIDVVDYKVLD